MKKKTNAFASAATLAGLLLSASAGATPVDYNGAKLTSSSLDLGHVLQLPVYGGLHVGRLDNYRTGANSLYIDAVDLASPATTSLAACLLTERTRQAHGRRGRARSTRRDAFCRKRAGSLRQRQPGDFGCDAGHVLLGFHREFLQDGSCDNNPNTSKPACTGQSIPDSAFLQTGNQIRADFYTNGVMSLAGPFTQTSSSSTSSSSLLAIGSGAGIDSGPNGPWPVQPRLHASPEAGCLTLMPATQVAGIFK